MKNNDYMTIDGMKVKIEGEKNLLTLIRKTGINLPTFCYHSDLSIYGACRMCVVEDDKGEIMASCSTVPREGMVIHTHTKRILKHRRMILELMLANHKRDCTICEKNDDCQLRILASRFGVYDIRFDDSRETYEIDDSSISIVRDPNKCILCGDCVRVCSETQKMGVLEFVNRGSEIQVMPAFNRKLADTNCVSCGQCVAACPTAALIIKDHTQQVWDALHDPLKRVVIQMAPAVRVALGEEFNLPPGQLVTGRTIAAMRRLGFDEVYDTSLAADITVIEEAQEFVDRLNSQGKFPMFTSCCPAWVKYVEEKQPDLLDHISSCKSPMQMLASVSKKHFAQKEFREKETVMVAVMPCTAKKHEAARKEFETDGTPDVDVVITTQELAYMIKEAGIDIANLDPESPDMPFGLASGSGILFGVTGGVAEAVIRRFAEEKTSEALKEITYVGVRGEKGIKEATIQVGEKEIKIAVVQGLRNAHNLVKLVNSGKRYYDFIEVMACPGGCVCGAGQPVMKDRSTRTERTTGIYDADRMAQLKWSDENPMVKDIYEKLLDDESSRHQLHVHYQK